MGHHWVVAAPLFEENRQLFDQQRAFAPEHVDAVQLF
jgi:hypothetical protein